MPSEEERLLAACGEVRPYLRPLVAFALETAMRRGELLALRRGEIRGNVAILRGTENGKDRAVPLSSRALAVLAELPASIDGRVFPIGEDSLEYYWRKARDWPAA
jgi:integrase